MKLAIIEREHLLAAATKLDESGEHPWSEYWMYVTEKEKEYPFKLLTRNAFQIASSQIIDPSFFQSNTGYRKYIEQKFGYKISFRVQENVPFFTYDDLNYFSQHANTLYRKDNRDNVTTGERLKATIYNKTNVWARALNIEGFKVELDNFWQIAGYFKKYSWATLFRSIDRNKKVFFTVGVDSEEEALVFKLDCQRKAYNHDKALTSSQQVTFDRIVKPTDAGWQSIDIHDLSDYSWERLMEVTREFIYHYIPLYDEVIEAIWNVSTSLNPDMVTTERNGQLNIKPVPSGQFETIPERQSRQKNTNPDYDGENKKKKQLGNAGESLVLNKEKAFLENHGRADLAALVCKAYDWEGYDILSFQLDGRQKFIEVKTTTGSQNRAFVFTRNEKKTMIENSDQYFLFRLYNFDQERNSGDCFILEGNFTDRVLEEPRQFDIYLKKTKQNPTS